MVIIYYASYQYKPPTKQHNIIYKLRSKSVQASYQYKPPTKQHNIIYKLRSKSVQGGFKVFNTFVQLKIIKS